MFAKIAKFPVASVLLVARRSAGLPSNDNTKHTAVALHRRRRPILACHWRSIIGGGLECYWDVEPANEAAAEEPDQRLIGARGLFGLACAA
jgi:hypothetical protein